MWKHLACKRWVSRCARALGNARDVAALASVHGTSPPHVTAAVALKERLVAVQVVLVCVQQDIFGMSAGNHGLSTLMKGPHELPWGSNSSQAGISRPTTTTSVEEELHPPGQG